MNTERKANLSLFLNVALLVIVIILLVRSSDSNSQKNSNALEKKNKGEKEQVGNKKGKETNKAGGIKGELRIAYVNSDSVTANFHMVEDKYEELEKDRMKERKRLQNRMKKFQKKVKRFQKEQTYMTKDKIKRKQQQLAKEQQRLRRAQSQLPSKFMKRKEELMLDLHKKINDFLDEYKKKSKYDMVFSYQPGGALLYANNSADITKEVIKGLNEQYSKETEKDSLIKRKEESQP